ncbi:iron(III) transport system ATP-binding protein [Virgibacillus natechei]|uniref:Iron(III) transport system ATP-binding protein n=1 Tax=Virgibacillus natechei TaxID=1216297 RepID=A0ABS4IDV2_9BACI|nr:ABC transporter ATP-binding protein [Virgibacillus natechei]MBP1969123.1 iron(III) transport system ATP-binding protein [Virgibacillus natechei]UZD14883.1 ABC transporter ATP-binding protein [Virgibacillus natechei]
MSFIQLENITKHFKGGEKPAVNSLQLNIEKGEIITLLGPSGCGKTTTLRMIAGFENPSEGSLHIDGKEVYSDSRTLPPEKRGIGMVFQDYALFPHMSILKNVMFGLNKWSIKAKKQRAAEVLELVGLEEYAHRYPTELSGGQQQRIALARALAPRPNVVLMDEPFSNLDASLREKMRFDVTNILRKTNTTAIIVTHDQKDAFAVSNRVVVMNDGLIQQIATPKEMYRCPKNCFVAQFVGKTNLLTGTMDTDLKNIHTHIGKVSLPTEWQEHLDTVKVSVRPEGCRLSEEGAHCGQVERVTYGGEFQELYVRLPGKQGLTGEPMLINAPVEKDVEVGTMVSFDITPELVALVE